MAQVLIRDLDEKVLKTLKQQAEQNKRSLQRELHVILARAATAGEAAHVQQRGGTPTRRKQVAPRGSVWNWLKRRSAGGLSKQEIDDYIRAERDSWNAA